MTSESMWDKLKRVDDRFEEIGKELSSPDIQGDSARIQKLSKEHKELQELVATYRSHEKAREELQGARDLIATGSDPEMQVMAQDEAKMLEGELQGLRERLKILLLPRDPNDEKNVILEIRAGAGGDEAGIFVGDLFRMYTRYAEGRGWRMELLSTNDASAGGYKEVIAMITGSGAYSRFKYESGVHRVQRVPKTEASGRIHTSTVTVAVLPEAEDVDVDIKETDLRIDVYRAGGHGGQSVNTTDSAVRITHLPTGMVVAIQDEKSQLKNKAKALKVLRSRLLEQEQRAAEEARQSDRRGQVGSGDRSEKIRTYNYPQSRVSDHRIGLTLHSLFEVMEGELDEIIDTLTQHYQAEALGQSGIHFEQ